MISEAMGVATSAARRAELRRWLTRLVREHLEKTLGVAVP